MTAQQYFGASAVARLTGKTPDAVRKHARRHGIGQRSITGGWIFNAADIPLFEIDSTPQGRAPLPNPSPATLYRREYRARKKAEEQDGDADARAAYNDDLAHGRD